MTGAQAFVACLQEEGIQYVFNVPGGQTLSLLDALFDAPDIRVVTARHESAAASMADGYGRMTGRPAAVIATVGPGATNLVTGVGNAHRDSVPMIVVTANNHRVDISHDQAQEADHVSLLRQFVKFTRFVPEAPNVVPATREAIRVALSGNPGPSHIDFARDSIETGEIDFVPRQPAENRALNKPLVADADIAALRDRIAAARRPVIWAGRGAIIAEAGKALVELAEILHAPMVSTYNGISAFPGDHPLSLGAYSKWGGRPGKRALAEADLVVVVGNSLNAISTSRWMMPLPAIVQVDCDPLAVGKRYPVQAGVVGDARQVMERLGAMLAGTAVPDERRQWVRELAKYRDAWRQEVMPEEKPGGRALDPRVVMKALTESFGPETIFVYDAGNAGIWAHTVPVQTPRHFMKSVGFGAMGFGLPAAIGAKLARPDNPVVVLVGDGSMAMTLGEIETAVREKANVIVVVFNDGAYGNIKQLQWKLYGQRNIAVDFCDVRFADVAKAMGADGERVASAAELKAAFARGRAAKTLYVIDAMIDVNVSIWNDPF
ncbi:MAG: thiamine pyrophosphate-binding protein [Reyranellaceae bacterium]